MTRKKFVSIKKIIRNALGKNRSEKYLRGMDSKFTSGEMNVIDIYQVALSQLLVGNTEKALNCVIVALDVERGNKLLLHLCKTMMFSLSQYMTESDIEKYKQQYSENLESSSNKLKKKIKDLQKIIEDEETELEKIEKELMKSRKNVLTYFFKKGKLKSEIQALKNGISKYNSEVDGVKTELNKIKKFVQMEEYIKVVALIIEVCAFPSRFESKITQTM